MTTSKYKEFLKWVILFIAIFFIIVFRRSDIIFDAKPWAEDGAIWLSQMYNDGFWNSILLPQNGYYQTISKITYAIALLFGVPKAALVANIIAISLRVFFVMFILSSRMNFIDKKYRIIAAIYFLIMPNLAEGYVNITNIHWYLSLYLLAVIISDKPRGKHWQLHDLTILIVSGLSGPFIVFLAPCLLIKRYYEQQGLWAAIKKINYFDLIFILIVLIQFFAICITGVSTRSTAPLGANIWLVGDITSFRIIFSTFFENSNIHLIKNLTFFNFILVFFFIMLLIYFFIKGNEKLKSAILFPVLVFSFTLARPMMSISDPQWPLFLYDGIGERYFFITNFLFFCFIVYLMDRFIVNKKIIIKACGVIFILLASQKFFIEPLLDYGYKEDILKFEKAQKGEIIDIRIVPQGWTMKLTKK